MATESQLDACAALRKKITLLILETVKDGDKQVVMTTLSQMLLDALYVVCKGNYGLMRQRLMGLVDAMERTVK